MNSLVKVTIAMVQAKCKNKQQQLVLLPPRGSYRDACSGAQLLSSPQRQPMCCQLLQGDFTSLSHSYRNKFLELTSLGLQSHQWYKTTMSEKVCSTIRLKTLPLIVLALTDRRSSLPSPSSGSTHSLIVLLH